MQSIPSMLLIGLLLTGSAHAQTPAAEPAPLPIAIEPNVTLKIREKGTGLGLGKTEVIINDQVLTTDKQGEVRIFVPAEGDGKVRLKRKGFESLDIAYTELRPAGTFDIFLYPRAGEDENVVVVTGKRRPQVSRKTVSAEESKKIAPGGDPAQVVKLLPGVQTSSGAGPGAGEVVVRGSGPRDSRYYIDDLEVPFIFHSIGDLSVIAAPLMQEVQFDAGGFGAEYGNATGGVIVIRTKTEIPERPRTEFVVNLPFYSGIYHERPLSESSMLAVSVRRSYIDSVIKQVLKQQEDEAGGSLTFVPYFGDVHTVYLAKDDNGHTKVSLLGAYDGVKAAVPADSFADENGRASLSFETSFINLGVERMLRLNKDWKVTTTPQVYYYQTDANFVGNEMTNKTQTVRAPTEFVRRLSKSEDLVIGFDPSYQVSKSDVNAIDFRDDDPTFDPEDAPKRKVSTTESVQTLAAWTSVDTAFGDTLLTSGFRSFYDGNIKKASADPRFRLRHALGENNALKAALGQYSQSPSPFQSSAGFGNPNLNFTKAIHYVLGIETKWNENWTTDIQAFYKTATQVITADNAKNYDNNGSLRAQGAEIFVRRNLTSRLFGWLSYTYSRTEVRDSDAEPFHESEYDQTHVLTLVGNYKLTSIWDMGGRYSFHTGDTYTPVTDTVYNANIDKYQERTLDSDENSKRLPNYNAVTLYATRQILFDTWKMAFKFGVESYWPQSQVVGVSYNYDYSKKQDQKGLTAIPFIELSGEI